jgi:hypothetical protein
LNAFGVDDAQLGGAFDIGRYEAAALRATPTWRAVHPGDTTFYVLRVYPPSFPLSLTLAVSCPSCDLTHDLSSTALNPGETVTLTVTDNHMPGTELVPGLWYTITVAATDGGATQYTDLRLLVRGTRIYLPLSERN